MTYDGQYQHTGPVNTRKVINLPTQAERQTWAVALETARETTINALRFWLPLAHPRDVAGLEDALAGILAGERWSIWELEALVRLAERSAQRDKTPPTAAERPSLLSDLYVVPR